MDQVKSMCSEDPELLNLLQDHPILLKTLETIPNLSSDQIFSILTAVENEAYILTKDLEEMKKFAPEKTFSQDPLIIENEELKAMIANEQEYNHVLNLVTFTQKISKLSESLSDLSCAVQQRNIANTNKLVHAAKLEKENKDLKNQIITLMEQLEFLTVELKSKTDSHGESFGKLEERIQELTVERNMLKKSKDPVSVIQIPQTTEVFKSNHKIAACLIFSVIAKNRNNLAQQIFSNWKFWIYKKSKLQEELEIKVKYKQLQQSFTHRSETLNELKAHSKKYFSQLLSAISSVNFQKPLEIELSSVELSKEWLDLLMQALENNSSVTELNLGSNQLSDDCGILLATWLKQDNYLKCLILRNNDFNEMVTSSLIEAVCLQNQIVMLDISENIVSVESISYLIQHSTSLSDLVIENCGLSGEDIKKILYVAKNSAISGLFVSYNPITKQALHGILELFSQTSLKNIGLSGLPFDDSDVKEICTLISKKNYLEILHLAHVEITEQGMSRVLDSLCKHDDLKEVDLTGTSLHIPHVCVVIETCSSLKTIVLREIIVSQRDYSSLADTIKKSPQLEVCLLDN